MQNSDIEELHWMMGMLNSINVGLVVIDDEYKITIWNTFMENHSGKRSSQIIGHVIFDMFSEISERGNQKISNHVSQYLKKTMRYWID